MCEYQLILNGKTQIVDADPATPLLYVLHDTLGLNGPKFGQTVSRFISSEGLLVGVTFTPLMRGERKK